jgi:hypothetical protein
MGTIGNFFKKNVNQIRISAMCARQDVLVIGFSNGVLLIFDSEKMDIKMTNKNFTKNDLAIDKLSIFDYSEIQPCLLYCLSDGMLTYYQYPQITFAGEILEEGNIVDFKAYEQN